MKKILIALMLVVAGVVSWAEGSVEEILERGVLRVGTTGDYKPFTYFDGKEYSGYDIEVAKFFGEQLGVEVEFVPTTWKSLTDDLEDEKFDIAMGGITRTLKRKLVVELSDPYLIFGKTPIVRKEDEKKFISLEAIDKKDVIVGVNIGGTNEKFADKYIKNAKIVRYEKNLDVPVAVMDGEVDVMISETPEAIYYANQYPVLASPMDQNPMTKSQLGYLIPKGDYELLKAINFIMHEMDLKGITKELKTDNIK